MSRGRFAVDSLTFVDRTIEGRDLATVAAAHLKETPAFWGRYFKRPGFSRDFSPIRESAILRRDGIRLLPIARQTTRVGGTVENGLEDGDRNVDAFLNAVGIDNLAAHHGELLMFLDVEGTGQDNPSLSLPYLIGWSNALSQRVAERSGERFTILPAVYARQKDDATWDAIAHAADLGHAPAGVWITRMRNGACDELPDWDPGFFMPSIALPCPVMAWQFALDCYKSTFDFSMVNPAPDVEEGLLSRLVIP